REVRLQPKSGLCRPNVTGHSPDDENARNRVYQSEQETAVEGGGSPQRCWLLEPERTWEQRPVRHAGVAEEAVNRVKGLSQPSSIEARCQITPREARPKSLVGVARGIAFSPSTGPKHPNVPLVHQREGQTADATHGGKQNRQRRSDSPRQSTRQPTNRRANHGGDQRADGTYDNLVG